MVLGGGGLRRVKGRVWGEREEGILLLKGITGIIYKIDRNVKKVYGLEIKEIEGY